MKPTVEAIRTSTRAVLARPEFQPQAHPLDGLQDWLESLLQHSLGIPYWVGWILLIVCTVVITWLLIRLLPGPGRRPTAARPAGLRLEVLAGAAATPAEALREARAALQRGDLRLTLWIAHRLLLLRLDQSGALRFAGWKTNSEYLKECSDPLFAELSQVYEQAIYAQREVSGERVGTLLDAVAAREAAL